MAPEDELEGEAFSLHQESAFVHEAWIVRGRRIFGVITSFTIGQGLAQGFTILAGLFLVHHLSIQSYAQLGLIIGLQTMFSTLMDFGFAGAIVPLVGGDKDDRGLVGRYVRSAKHLRDRSFVFLAPIATLALVGIMRRQQWSGTLQIALLLPTLLALYSSGKSSYFSAVLILHGRLRSYYLLQIAGGLFRLVSYIVLALTGSLNAWIAAAIGAITIWFTAEWYGREAKPLIDWPARDDLDTDRKMFHYILPAAPAIVFTAFQAQLTLFLISVFGGQTAYIAQVAALGRVSQVFTVLNTFNLIVVEPFVARLNHRKLLPTFVALTVIACTVLTPLVYAAFVWPQAFLLLIGPKYGSLRDLLGWVILTATTSYIAGLIWMMNRARQWVFWSGSIMEIGLLVVVQTFYVARVGIKNPRDAVFLTLTASLCVLIAHIYVSVLGFWRTRRNQRASQGRS